MAGPPKTRASDFRQAVTGLFVLGFLLLLVGVGVMVGNWPDTTFSPGYESLGIAPTYDATGSGVGVFFGGVIAAVGQIMVAIAIIACGVHVGTRVPAHRVAS